MRKNHFLEIENVSNMKNVKSIIYPSVILGKNVIIEPFCIIGLPGVDNGVDGLKTYIGDNSYIRSHTVIYAGNRIGDNFKTGHFTLIRENNVIGDDCSIGSFSEVAFNVKIGNNVRIHSKCSIFEESVIEDNVKINPGVSLLNTKYPFRKDKKAKIEPVKIRKGARITANCTILPGIEIGENALIGAGSLVTKKIPKNHVAFGTPAIIKGLVKNIRDKKGVKQYE